MKKVLDIPYSKQYNIVVKKKIKIREKDGIIYTMKNVKAWEMNETQKEFVAVLKELGRPATLMEVNAVSGKNFKTGSVNALVTKGVVATEDVELAYTETKTFKFGDTEVASTVEKTVTRKAYALV